MPKFEELKYVGSFDLQFAISFSYVKQILGEGHSNRISTGSTAGVRDWKLVYKVLPQTLDSPIMVGTEPQSRADYLWDFYCRHQGAASKSFIITCLRDRKRYLVGFADARMSYQMFAIKLFSSGLALEYRREDGVATLDDGSLGLFENPDEI